MPDETETETLIQDVLSMLDDCAATGNTAELRCIAKALDGLALVAAVSYRAVCSRLAGNVHRANTLEMRASHQVDGARAEIAKLREEMAARLA